MDHPSLSAGGGVRRGVGPLGGWTFPRSSMESPGLPCFAGSEGTFPPWLRSRNCRLARSSLFAAPFLEQDGQDDASRVRLRFLGTGPSEPIPRPGHDDPLCRAARAGGKSRRSRSAALLRDEDRTILIDAGPDLPRQLSSDDVREIAGVLVTHGHRDAVDGIGWLDAHVPHPIPLRSHAATCARLTRRFGPFRRLVPQPVSSGRVFTMGRLRATAFGVAHSLQAGFPTFGFLLGASFAYASDVGSIPPSSKETIRGVRTLVLDAAMWFDRPMPAHLTVDQAVAIGAELDVETLVLTQIGHTFPPHEEAEEAARAFLRGLDAERPHDLRIAYDGMDLDIAA